MGGVFMKCKKRELKHHISHVSAVPSTTDADGHSDARISSSLRKIELVELGEKYTTADIHNQKTNSLVCRKRKKTN